MRETAHKVCQAALLWAIALSVLGVLWPPAIRFASLWVLVAVSVLTNVLQPPYPLTAPAEGGEDRGTFVHIVASVYVTQIAALLELLVRKPLTLPFDALAWGALTAMVGGLGLRIWAVRTLGRSFTLRLHVEPGQRIIQDGPYRWIRHPSYAGAWLTFVASCVLLGSWVAAGLAAATLAAAFARRIRCEERLMAERCPGYQAYAARTGALLPRVWPARRPSSWSRAPRKV
jgi:protein-S-isoprenylcysteine O-methyltransferase Ste14